MGRYVAISSEGYEYGGATGMSYHQGGDIEDFGLSITIVHAER